MRLGGVFEDEDATEAVILGGDLGGDDEFAVGGEHPGVVVAPAAAAQDAANSFLAWPSGAPFPHVAPKVVQAKRVARKRADRAGAVKAFAAKLRAEVAAVGWLRLAKRGDPLARGRQAVALIGGEQAALAFALAEPRAKNLSVVPVDVDGGVAVGVLKPGGLPAVGGGVGKGGIIGDSGFPDAEPGVAAGQLDKLHAKAVDKKLVLVVLVKTWLGRRVAAATGEQPSRR